MSAPEQLIYLIVLLRIYESGGACADSLGAFVKRTGYNKRVVTDALDELFKAGRLRREADGIHNPVADSVISDAVAFREGRKRAGEKGASRRWEKTKQNQKPPPSTAMRQPMANDSHLHLQEESLFPNGNKAPILKNGSTPEADLFRRGREVLGPESGGFIKRILKAKGGSIPKARAAIEKASEKNDPREYLGGVIRAGNRDHDDTVDGRL
jgi:hypothetical protein